jgi:hypothetical protein
MLKVICLTCQNLLHAHKLSFAMSEYIILRVLCVLGDTLLILSGPAQEV